MFFSIFGENFSRVNKGKQKMSDPEPGTSALPYSQNVEAAVDNHLDWDDFRILMAVVQSGSFNRAATALGLTQPTVSRRIERLEKTVAAQLVDRTKNGAALTYEGQRIVEEVMKAQSAFSRALNRANATGRRPDSEVKLSVTDGIASYWFPIFLPELYRQFPDLEVRLWTSNDLYNEKRSILDMHIHFNAPAELDHVSLRLGTMHFIPYAAPEYLDRHGCPSSIADLAKHRLLDFTLYLVDKGTWGARLADVTDCDRTQFFTNSSPTLAEAVRRGAGIGLLPTYGSAYDKSVVPIDLNMRYETPIWLSYRREAVSRWAVHVIVQFLKRIIDRKRMPWFGDRYVHPSKFALLRPSEVLAGLAEEVNRKPMR